MKFRYLGDGDQPCKVFGVWFMAGVETEVSDDDAHAIAKLKNNQHFEAVADDAPAAKPARKPKAEKPVTDEDA